LLAAAQTGVVTGIESVPCTLTQRVKVDHGCLAFPVLAVVFVIVLPFLFFVIFVFVAVFFLFFVTVIILLSS
jgi:hypothetical protein